MCGLGTIIAGKYIGEFAVWPPAVLETSLLPAPLGSAHFAHCSAQILFQESMKQMLPTLAPHR